MYAWSSDASKTLVLFLEVEQRTRRDGDDELAVQGDGHAVDDTEVPRNGGAGSAACDCVSACGRNVVIALRADRRRAAGLRAGT
jgi:hypothetical protein